MYRDLARITSEGGNLGGVVREKETVRATAYSHSPVPSAERASDPKDQGYQDH